MGNTLDLVLTSDDDLIGALKVHQQNETPLSSDHFMVSFSLNVTGVSAPCKCMSVVFDYPKANWDGLCNYLLDSDFSMCFEEDDVEVIWSIFKHIVITALNMFIPKVQMKNHQFPRWFTPYLRHKHKCLHTMEKKCARNPSLLR